MAIVALDEVFRTTSTPGVAGLHPTSQQSEHYDISLIPVNKNDLCLNAMQENTRISPFAQKTTLALQFCYETRSVLTLWRRNYFSNFSTLCIQNVNNTGTKYVRIMKQTAF